ncbi:MAG: glycerate kinase [Acidobacteria bacterium]|nr:glycerate kinase [Acidobacteriota bacterium]
MKSRQIMRDDAARIWSAALQAVEPEAAVRRSVKLRGNRLKVGDYPVDLSRIRKIWVLGAGKAAAPMGAALESILGKRVAGGLLVTKYGHGLPLRLIELLEAGHPLPDQNGIEAGRRIEALAREEIGMRDLVFVLLSGGGSALLVSPAEGISLEDKLETTRLLLSGGATIHELNAVRKHLSRLKGGQMARLLAHSRVFALVLSDVVGDDLDTIASGPLAPDTTTFGDCLEILERYRVVDGVPQPVRRRFEAGVRGLLSETPKQRDSAFRNCRTVFVGNNALACRAAAGKARRLGYHTMVLTSRLEGDTGEAARFHMSVATEVALTSSPLRRPACILSGGETTVRVTGSGKGGRNQEFALHCARTLARMAAPCIVASLGTDGTDGPTDAAGALADNTTVARSLKLGAGFLADCLRDNNSYEFFRRLDDLIITGPTRTNVMDLHIILIG